MSFRDLTVVIIETSRTVVRAGLGLHELLKTPSVVCAFLILVPSSTCHRKSQLGSVFEATAVQFYPLTPLQPVDSPPYPSTAPPMHQ